MYLAVMIYAAIALLYFIAITCIAKREAKKRKRRFPRYRNHYTIEYKRLVTRSIIFPYDIARRGYIYTKWVLMNKY